MAHTNLLKNFQDKDSNTFPSIIFWWHNFFGQEEEGKKNEKLFASPSFLQVPRWGSGQGRIQDSQIEGAPRQNWQKRGGAEAKLAENGLI